MDQSSIHPIRLAGLVLAYVAVSWTCVAQDASKAGVAEARRSIPKADQLFAEAETLRKNMNPFRKEKNYRKAVGLYQDLVRRFPASDKVEAAWYQTGNIYESVFYMKWAKAVQAYHKVLEVNPESTCGVQVRLAQLYENRLGDKNQALTWYRRAMRRMPEGAARSEAKAKVRELRAQGYKSAKVRSQPAPVVPPESADQAADDTVDAIAPDIVDLPKTRELTRPPQPRDQPAPRPAPTSAPVERTMPQLVPVAPEAPARQGPPAYDNLFAD